ncbi:MAG TPA: S41 family peptidase [Flavobacterium sp.]|jgi:C-terminal processing protease CtpA/Prc
MKNLLRASIFLFSFLFVLQGCDEKDDLEVPSDVEVQDFVWKGMNLFYLWQEDVPDLDDDRFSSQDDLNEFLREYPDPIDLFEHLRVDPSIDRFSVIYSDYRILEGVLTGTAKNNGIDFGLRLKSGSTTDVFGWVRYILPNSSASAADIQRGDIFYAVNGIPLTVSNYQSLLANDTYTLNLADYDNGNITPNGQSVTVTKTEYSENPVLITNVYESGSHRIGYLMYNGFYTGYENQLNAAFGQLASQNITDLVLDLRYNSGGSVATSTRLASMITGQFTGQLFAKEQWNSKLQAHYEEDNPESLMNNFTSELGNGGAINHLNLNRVYVLTSRSTASASELVINGLEPYIDVIQIGDLTTGKNVGSVTLYDSPDFGPENKNPDHKYAMQPLVLKIVNKDNFGDYLGGLVPDHLVIENLADLGQLGNENEALFSTAIGLITGSARRMRQSQQETEVHFSDSKSLNNIQNQMFVDKVPKGMLKRYE